MSPLRLRLRCSYPIFVSGENLDFASLTGVTVGGTRCTNTTIISPQLLICTAPARANSLAGPVMLSVKSVDAAAAASNATFTYTVSPFAM